MAKIGGILHQIGNRLFGRKKSNVSLPETVVDAKAENEGFDSVEKISKNIQDDFAKLVKVDVLGRSKTTKIIAGSVLVNHKSVEAGYNITSSSKTVFRDVDIGDGLQGADASVMNIYEITAFEGLKQSNFSQKIGITAYGEIRMLAKNYPEDPKAYNILNAKEAQNISDIVKSMVQDSARHTAWALEQEERNNRSVNKQSTNSSCDTDKALQEEKIKKSQELNAPLLKRLNDLVGGVTSGSKKHVFVNINKDAGYEIKADKSGYGNVSFTIINNLEEPKKYSKFSFVKNEPVRAYLNQSNEDVALKRVSNTTSAKTCLDFVENIFDQRTQQQAFTNVSVELNNALKKLFGFRSKQSKINVEGVDYNFTRKTVNDGKGEMLKVTSKAVDLEMIFNKASGACEMVCNQGQEVKNITKNHLHDLIDFVNDKRVKMHDASLFSKLTTKVKYSPSSTPDTLNSYNTLKSSHLEKQVQKSSS